MTEAQTERRPPPLGQQCEGVHDGWRKAMFCVIDTTTGLHTHVCHLHRRLLHNEFSTVRSSWMKCGHQTDVAEPIPSS